MNLTAIFLLSAALGASAKGHSQTVTLDMKNAPIQKVFREVIRQTGTSIVYNEALFKDASPITIQVRNATIADVLVKCLHGRPFTFNIEDNSIVIQKKPVIALKPEMAINPPPPIQVHGQVKDETGSPLLNASIIIKGTSTGVTSDANGNFNIEVPGNSTVLVISYTGYVSQEIQVGNRTTIEVTMNKADNSLNAVVVTALGIKREAKSLGYATTTVSPKEMTVNRTPQFMNALEGKVAGVNITTLGSGPGGSTKIRIRGQSSLGGENSPLIVINGVPVDNTNFGARSGLSGEVRGSHLTVDGGDGLSSINPDDIESMTILKGAAASALYGSRAKDGVIMITTKNRGKGKGIEIEYNANYTLGTPLDYTDYQYEYGQGENGKRPTSPNPTSGVWSFGEKFEPGMTQILFDSVVVPYEPQRNHIKDYYRNANSLSNTVNIASGGEFGGFNLSLSNLGSESIFPGSNFNRKNVNVGFTQTFNKKLTISGNVNYSHELNKNPANVAEEDYSPVALYTMANSMPLSILKKYATNENGDENLWSRFTDRTNPYFALERFDNIEKDRVYGNITANYAFTDWLYLQGRIGQDFYSREQDYNLPTGATRSNPAPPGFVNGEFVQDARRFREINMDFLLGAKQTFGNFGVDMNLGGNRMYRTQDRHNVLAQDFYVRGLYTIGNGRQLSPIYQTSEREVNSLYGTLGFSYKGFLYLNGTMRNDWFSTLSPGNRSILYPSVSTSFVFSQAFNLPDWVSFGKLRLSYAEVGSDADVAPYSNNLYYSINASQFPNPAGSPQPIGNISGTTVPNPKLLPMRAKEDEIGLELQLFNSSLGFNVSYYNKLSTGQIVQAQISSGSGYTTQLINVGESRNRGVEMLVTVSPLRKTALKWDASFNAAYNITKVLSLGNDVSDSMITVGSANFHGELRQVVGEEMGQLYGYGYLRDDQGRKVFDANTGLPLKTPNQIPFGSALPKWVGGFTNSFTYKNAIFSFLIDFKLGNKMISGTHTNAYREGLDKATLVGREEGYVIGDGVNPDGNINKTKANVQPFYEVIRTLRMSEQSVFNAGLWELRQVTLGYDLTKFVIGANKENSFFKGLRLNLVMNNVAVLKKWVPHIHPEQNGLGSDNLIGLEATGLPLTRNIGFNLNVRF